MPVDQRHSGWRAWLVALPILTLLFVIGCVTGAGQPHMASALDHLQAARGELQAAEHNKGGHRARALELVDRAIGEVRAGMEFAGSR